MEFPKRHFIQDGTDTSGLAPRKGAFAQAKRRGAARRHRGGSPFPETPEQAPALFIRTVAVLAFFLAGGTPAFSQALREYDLKAVFLYNFATFIDWPPSAFADNDAPFVIGILGDDPFGPVLDDVVRGERVRNRPIVVRRIWRMDETTACHLVFVCWSEAWHIRDVLRELRGRPVLTVADVPGFPEGGGIIGFQTRDNRVHLTINARAARAAQLAVSSKLLQLAHVLDPERSVP